MRKIEERWKVGEGGKGGRRDRERERRGGETERGRGRYFESKVLETRWD